MKRPSIRSKLTYTLVRDLHIHIDHLESQLKERDELIAGLIRDFDEVISDYDIEPDRAGYLVEAKELLNQKER